ncbi:MAG TPA: alpha-1,6-glucosidase domain-containing protein [Burkholderiaceae bacterium]|nr:alpha-1,6-glucosidase domain-containing protein [Burkholderiaceae bacterium]
MLHASAALPASMAQARAAWLDAQRLRWAGQGGDGRWRLLHSRDGRLRLAAGEPATGVDAALALDIAAEPPPSEATRRFSHIGAGVTLAVRAVDRRRLPEVHRGQLMLVREDAAGRVLAATAVQAAGALDALYASAESVPDLGATVRSRHTDFKLWAPTARRVSLCVAGQAPQAMRRDARTGVWSAAVPKPLHGRSYAFAVDVFVRGRGVVRNLVTDPYSLSLTTDSQRSVVIDPNAPDTQPAGWRQTRAPQRVAHPVDMAIYELHVRDFSIGDRSVSEANRGKYLAFTEANSRGMRHLRALSDAGMTDVHLLPVFDLASVPEKGCTTPTVPNAPPDGEAQQAAVMAEAATDCFNWGYDPWHFTAPEGSFATDASDGITRVREFRAMVQALHRANLRVGMDMVYNHTTASGQHPKSVLDRIVPGYYQRLNADGVVERSTCCDNTATEHRMMAKLMIDSAVVWARDYKIDSMRFDLMGHQPRAAMERLARAVNSATGRRIDLIGEGWNFGEVENGKRFVQAAQKSLNGSGIGSFSDRGRDAARGSGWGSPEDTVRNKGWIHGEGSAAQADLLRVGLAGTLESFVMTDRHGQRVPLSRVDYNGQPAGFASQPSEVVNYVENHDNQTLFDNNATKLPIATSREDRARVQTLGAALVALSQGIAYFHAGQEILRSKSLDRNSYDSGDWFNRLDWSLEDNGFGAGLPPAGDNKEHWRVMQPLLAASGAIKPTNAEIVWTRDAFLELLRIRASTALLRLRSADEVAKRLTFPNSGAQQNPHVVVGHLDGEGLPGANFRALLYAINAAPAEQALTLEALKGHPFVPHPAHRAPGAGFDAATGTLRVPARTAVVLVVAP